MTSLRAFKKKGSEWPPRIFKCEKLESLLKEKLGDKYSVVNVAVYLDITPITMKKILLGGTVSLENSIKLAQLLGKEIEEIWSLR